MMPVCQIASEQSSPLGDSVAGETHVTPERQRGRADAWAAGVRFGRKPKLIVHQQREVRKLTQKPFVRAVNLHQNLTNYGYAMLESQLRIETSRIGLDHATGFLHQTMADRPALILDLKDAAAESTASIPVGRYGNPKEHGDAAVFFASARAAYLTGSVPRIDGGLIASI
jgi:hypothetical protein